MVNIRLFYRVFYIPGGAGFLPSTVWWIWGGERYPPGNDHIFPTSRHFWRWWFSELPVRWTTMFPRFLEGIFPTKKWRNCWWKKACTTQHVWNPVNNRIFAIPTGAGFLQQKDFSPMLGQPPHDISSNLWGLEVLFQEQAERQPDPEMRSCFCVGSIESEDVMI